MTNLNPIEYDNTGFVPADELSTPHPTPAISITKAMWADVSPDSPRHQMKGDSLNLYHASQIRGKERECKDAMDCLMAHKDKWVHAKNYLQKETEVLVLSSVFDTNHFLGAVRTTRQLEINDGTHSFRLKIDDLRANPSKHKDWIINLMALAVVEQFIEDANDMSAELSKTSAPLHLEIEFSGQTVRYAGARELAMKAYWKAFGFMGNENNGRQHAMVG
jgi:hypothetical protein